MSDAVAESEFPMLTVPDTAKGSPARKGALLTTTTQSGRAPFRLPIWLATCLLGSVALFFAWTEHRAHLLGVLPYLLFLACPLTHLLMHRGHEHDHGSGDSSSGRQDHGHDRGASR